MKTFCIQTLGCKVNHYETEQLASLLRSWGWAEADADQSVLRIVNTCSVTSQAARQSRQTIRRLVRLPICSEPTNQSTTLGHDYPSAVNHPSGRESEAGFGRVRTIATGCWATSDRAAADALGVDAVLTHHDNLAVELPRLLELWFSPVPPLSGEGQTDSQRNSSALPPRSMIADGWMIKGGTAAATRTDNNRSKSAEKVNANPIFQHSQATGVAGIRGSNSLPLLGQLQSRRQRAFLKVQDGCDAHCTYCIIPKLRPYLYSKPIDDATSEARRLVAAGHVELVLTGIFLGAYGQSTALRRRQTQAATAPIADLIEALCTKVPGLLRLRLSSLEPGDLTPQLLRVMRSHHQIVPHFHLPLQSGSNLILRRMNRQYSRDDFLRMVEEVGRAFDRPTLTTDIMVGFPGETEQEFAQTIDVAEQSRFIQIHAFAFSPRPGTAAARWKRDFVPADVMKQRVERLSEIAQRHSLEFRSSFLDQTVRVISERDNAAAGSLLHHGRCERYFDVHFESATVRPGDLVSLRIERVTPARTFGRVDQ